MALLAACEKKMPDTFPLPCPIPPSPTVPQFDTVMIGDTVRFRLSGNPDPTHIFRWSSDRPTVATIDSLSGLARARLSGTAMVTAIDITQSTPNCVFSWVGALTVR